MYSLRRAASRALSASNPIFAKPQSISATALVALKAQQKWLNPTFQSRFYGRESSDFGSEVAQGRGERQYNRRPARGQYQPRASPSQSNLVYVGNLFFEVTQEQLTEVFSKFGVVTESRIIYDQRGLSRGFAFVQFEKAQDAAAAIENLDQQNFQGRRMVVQAHVDRPRGRSNVDEAKPRVEHPPSKTLFIGNMSFEVSDKDIHDLFRGVENCIEIRIAADRSTNRFRGFCHADFLDVESATKAKEQLVGKQLYGRGIRIDYSAFTPRYNKLPAKELEQEQEDAPEISEEAPTEAPLK